MTEPKHSDDHTEMRRFRERGIKENAAFHAQMLALGYVPHVNQEASTSTAHVSNPSVGGGARSNADF